MSFQITLPDMESPSAAADLCDLSSATTRHTTAHTRSTNKRTLLHTLSKAHSWGTLIGTSLSRGYRFCDRQLVLTSSRPDERWTIAWEHH
jgi:hypothetical protein